MTYDNNLQNNHNPLEFALFKAAQVANIELMRELILAGANPFVLDEKASSPFMYAMKLEPKKTADLMRELENVINVSLA